MCEELQEMQGIQKSKAKPPMGRILSIRENQVHKKRTIVLHDGWPQGKLYEMLEE